MRLVLVREAPSGCLPPAEAVWPTGASVSWSRDGETLLLVTVFRDEDDGDGEPVASLAEALEVVGLPPCATESDLLAAHRRGVAEGDWVEVRREWDELRMEYLSASRETD